MSNNNITNNNIIIDEFNKLILFNTENNPQINKYKLNSYKNVISIIEKLDFEITKDNIKELNKIAGIGKSTIERIIEILDLGYLQEINSNINLEQQNILKNKKNIMSKLKTIHGIGDKKAEDLYNKNITISNISNHLDELTSAQKIGLKYYKDIKLLIPNDEINKYKIKLSKLFNKLDKKLQFEICGSYRRQKELCGDIDILITNTSFNLQDIINYLYDNKILIDHLTLKGNSKYMGISQLNKDSHFRRIDIRLIPKKSYYYAILYFTGSKNTNKYMREKAIEKNWKLNEYELINENNESLTANSEEDIFKLLELDYIIPAER